MDPWTKIMRAYNDPAGVRGCRLTADDVLLLGQDSAIETRAQVMIEEACQTRGRHRFDKVGNCACGEKREPDGPDAKVDNVIIRFSPQNAKQGPVR